MASLIKTQADFRAGRSAAVMAAAAAVGGAGGGASSASLDENFSGDIGDPDVVDEQEIKAEESEEDPEFALVAAKEAAENAAMSALEDMEFEAKMRALDAQIAAFKPTRTRTFFVIGHGATSVTEREYLETEIITDLELCRPPFLNCILDFAAVPGTRLNHSLVDPILKFLNLIKGAPVGLLQHVFPPLKITVDGVPFDAVPSLYKDIFVTARTSLEGPLNIRKDPDFLRKNAPTLAISCIGPGTLNPGDRSLTESNVSRMIKTIITGYKSSDLPVVKVMTGFHELISDGTLKKIQRFPSGFMMDTGDIVEQIMRGWRWSPEFGEPYDIRIVFAHCGKFQSTSSVVRSKLKAIPYGFAVPPTCYTHKKGQLLAQLMGYWTHKTGGGGAKAGGRRRKTAKRRYLKYSRKTRVRNAIKFQSSRRALYR